MITSITRRDYAWQARRPTSGTTAAKTFYSFRPTRLNGGFSIEFIYEDAATTNIVPPMAAAAETT